MLPSPATAVVARAVVLATRFRATPFALWAKRRVMSVSAPGALAWMAKVRCATCAKIVRWDPARIFRCIKADCVKI